MNTLNPTQRHAIQELVALRHAARNCLKARRMRRTMIPQYEAKASAIELLGDKATAQKIRACVEVLKEDQLNSESGMVEIGQRLLALSRAMKVLDVPREAWLNALSVNRAEWNSSNMLAYGQELVYVVAVLKLENSATKEDDIEIRPLHFCQTMAMLNEMKVNRAFDRAVHEAIKEFFGDAFGEYQERSPLERMGVPAHMIPQAST